MSNYDRYAEQFAAMLTELDADMDVNPGSANYDFIIKPNASVAAALYDQIVNTLDNMSITQVLSQDDPDDDLVNILLSNLRVKRRDPSTATGYVSIKFTGNTNVNIPGSAVFECAGIRLRPLKTYVATADASAYTDTEETAFVQAVTYDDGTKAAIIGVSSIDSFVGTLSTGQACTFSLTDPRVSSVTIASTITGNATETNEELLALAVAGVSATVLTGADNIKNYFLNNEEYPVRDAAVFGMGSEVMVRDKSSGDAAGGGGSVDVYVRTEETPQILAIDLTATRIDDVTWEADIPADVIPGAISVLSVAYGTNRITDYAFIPSARTNSTWPRINKDVDARYGAYQESKLRITYPYLEAAVESIIVKVEVMYVGGIDILQTMVEDPDVRSNAFDVMVKAGIPVNTSVHATIKMPRGSELPTSSSLQTVVAAAINALPIGTEQLYTSVISEALKAAQPTATVVMPIHLDAAVYMPDGRTLYAHSDAALQAPVAEAISYENTMFVCYPGNVSIVVMEE